MIWKAEQMRLAIFTEPQQGASYDDQRRLGSGWFETEHTAYGIPFPSLGERFDRLTEQRSSTVRRGPGRLCRYRPHDPPFVLGRCDGVLRAG
jgi:hypothetical protein